MRLSCPKGLRAECGRKSFCFLRCIKLLLQKRGEKGFKSQCDDEEDDDAELQFLERPKIYVWMKVKNKSSETCWLSFNSIFKKTERVGPGEEIFTHLRPITPALEAGIRQHSF